MKNKKGVTVQNTLIILILLIVSAALLFFILNGIPFKESSEKEACRQSVLTRSRDILGTHPLQALTPLNCKTQEIQITTTNEEMIKREISNSMYDCWSILGEGKLDFFGDSFWGIAQGIQPSKATCVICSTIKFSGQIKDHPKELELLRYLEETKISDKNITYLEYFSDQSETKLDPILRTETVKTNQDYAVIFMGIHGGNIKDLLIKTGVTAAGGGFIGSRITPGATGWLAAIGGLYQAITGVISLIGSNKAAAAYCDGNIKGCMVMTLVPLDAKSISNSCEEILSIT